MWVEREDPCSFLSLPSFSIWMQLRSFRSGSYMCSPRLPTHLHMLPVKNWGRIVSTRQLCLANLRCCESERWRQDTTNSCGEHMLSNPLQGLAVVLYTALGSEPVETIAVVQDDGSLRSRWGPSLRKSSQSALAIDQEFFLDCPHESHEGSMVPRAMV